MYAFRRFNSYWAFRGSKLRYKLSQAIKVTCQNCGGAQNRQIFRILGIREGPIEVLIRRDSEIIFHYGDHFGSSSLAFSRCVTYDVALYLLEI